MPGPILRQSAQKPNQMGPTVTSSLQTENWGTEVKLFI